MATGGDYDFYPTIDYEGEFYGDYVEDDELYSDDYDSDRAEFYQPFIRALFGSGDFGSGDFGVLKDEEDSDSCTGEGDGGGGGYECHFLSVVPDSLQCLICTNAARDAQQVDCCGKVFCKICLRKLRKSQHRACPNCRENKWKSFPDKKSKIF